MFSLLQLLLETLRSLHTELFRAWLAPLVTSLIASSDCTLPRYKPAFMWWGPMVEYDP